jgi:hypothetical protein
MRHLDQGDDRYDEYIRLEQAIESNKRYLKQLNKTVLVNSCDDIYLITIRAQEKLLNDITKS